MHPTELLAQLPAELQLGGRVAGRRPCEGVWQVAGAYRGRSLANTQTWHTNAGL